MFPELRAAAFLLTLTVVIHTLGMVALLRWMSRSQPRFGARFWTVVWLLIRITWSLIVIHLLEVIAWALFYLGQDCLPDLESAFYFSGVTYSTVGYGDLVLPKEWRLLGPAEGLTGILMCGLSTGFFFAVFSRLYAARKQGAQE
jgi:hypothetical protein